MRLRAQITLEFDAADYVEAARHQRILESLLEEVNRNYASARLAIRERRERESERSVQYQDSRLLSIAK